MPTEIDVLLKEMKDIRTFVDEKVALGLKPLKEEYDRMGRSLTAVEEFVREARRQRIAHFTSDGKLMVTEGRLAGYSALDLAMLKAILDEKYEKARETPPIYQDIANARKSLVASLTPESLFEWEERGLKERRTAYGFADMNPGVRQFKGDLQGWRNAVLELVRKALDSTTTGAGDELVPTLEAAELWLDVNLETVILPILQQVPMPSNPFDYPIQFGDVNWYPSTENVASASTSVATQKVTLTAKGLRAGIPFSDELEEDAIIALVPELRRQMAMNAAQVIDDVLLNADQTATNGINSDGATIATDTAGKAHWLLGFDGIIHAGIVDNSAGMSVNVNTAITAAAFTNTLVKMGKYAAPNRRSDVLFVSDVNTAIAALAISQVATLDVFGERATISSGEIANIYGKPYLHTSQMRLADTDGKVTNSGGNTVGRILAFNSTQWRVGFRRQITMEADREAGKGQTTLYTTLRLALTERSGTRSSQTHTAISYNITGVA